MFLFMGIFPLKQVLDYQQIFLCNHCQKKMNLKVVQTCSRFYLFFIPLFKWNKRFHVVCEECGCIYELHQDVGLRIAAKENVFIVENDLVIVHKPNFTYACPKCGKIVQNDFDFCPSCGVNLENKSSKN